MCLRVKTVVTQEEERVIRQYLSMGEKRLQIRHQQKELQQKRNKFYKEIMV